MNFSEALLKLKDGVPVTRSGWNGANQFIYLVLSGTYPSTTEVAKREFGDSVTYGAYLAIKPAQGNVVPWIASQTDLLADDWEIHEQKED